MSCNEEKCCNNGSCGPKKEDCSTGCEMTDMMIGIADKAWEKLMVEKMKVQWEKLRGPNMDKMAKAGVKASMLKWSVKMDAKHKQHEAKEVVKSAFMD